MADISTAIADALADVAENLRAYSIAAGAGFVAGLLATWVI